MIQQEFRNTLVIRPTICTVPNDKLPTGSDEQFQIPYTLASASDPRTWRTPAPSLVASSFAGLGGRVLYQRQAVPRVNVVAASHNARSDHGMD
jgi:hypothetical protein